MLHYIVVSSIKMSRKIGHVKYLRKIVQSRNLNCSIVNLVVMPKARGGGREDQPHAQGAVAAWVQEGLEELSHVEGQERWQ